MNFYLLSSFVLLIAPPSAAALPAHAEGGGRPITLPATSNVADAIRSNRRGKFVIKGLSLRDDEGGNPFNDPFEFDISFRATTSYADDAVHIDERGQATPISTDSVVLVPDAAERNFFGAILVNTHTGRSKGFLVDKAGTVGPRGKSYRVTQERAGGKKSAMGLEKGNGSFAAPKDWACDAVAAPGQGHSDARDLTTGDEVHRLRHRHHHHHEDEDDATSDILGSMLDGMAESFGLRRDPRRRHLLVGQGPYHTDTFPNMYSYEVQIYMEYDNDLEFRAGRTTEDVVDYINVLNAAVSSVYEYEVDTRITISVLEKTTRYDNAYGTYEPLDIMRATFAGNNFGGGNSKIDLHHALLGRLLGGGIAYKGVLCSSDYGFGLTGSMDADFSNIEDPAGLVWDFTVYAHEVGHNFAADHTHEWPTGAVVDTCGDDGGCPNELDGTATGKATIMSYCGGCSGGTSNVGPTFGGHRDVQTPHPWQDECTLGVFNVEPHRVPQKMYNHVSSLGTCVEPEGIIPAQTLKCGNGVLDAGEDCEDGINFTKTCETLGDYPYLASGGTLGCASCAWDTSNCNGCGNKVKDGAEECDKNDFGSNTCETQGFSEGGYLICTPECNNVDTSGCMKPVLEETDIGATKGKTVARTVTINKATNNIKIAISGGTGDADLYVKYGEAPTTVSFDCRSHSSGNEEVCSYNRAGGNPEGTYHILIRASTKFSKLTLKVTRDDTPPCYTDAECDDGIYCNGAETCNAGTCQAGTPEACDDGVACTVDSCNLCTDSCEHVPDDALCDNGLYCDGVETCDAGADCQAGTPPSCTHGCNEVADQCYECTGNGDCDDGLYCDGQETCQSGYCQAGFDPCFDRNEFCKEANRSCYPPSPIATGSPESNLTATQCEELEFYFKFDPVLVAQNLSCSISGGTGDADLYVKFDSLPTLESYDCRPWMDGNEETCSFSDRTGVAYIMIAPLCYPYPDFGFPSFSDITLECTGPSSSTCNVPADCDDGLYCNGAETCNVGAGTCQAGTPPVCDDGVACTVDSCNESTDSCDYAPNNALCDDGLYCNGAETCDAGAGCQAGAAPSCIRGCDESQDQCIESSPTSAPTTSPTAAPSKSPINPTNNPSTSPSKAPTSSPVDPTNSPSRAPSRNPTRTPSGSPSIAPITNSPSASSTKAPSSSPINPTNNTTANPSRAPSPKPFSDSPSTNPTRQPSSSPSKSPSSSPAKAPTTSPVDPTNSPSRMPTTSPVLVGQCPDGINTCTETNLSQCSCSNRRYLIKGREQSTSMVGLRGNQSRRKLKPKKTPVPTQSSTAPPPPTASPSSSPSRPNTTSPTSNPTAFVCKCLFPTPEPTQPPTAAATPDPTTSPIPACVCSAYTDRDNCKAACGGSSCNWTGNPKTCGPV